MLKNSVEFKNKTIDLDSVITRANIKKYLTVGKLNRTPEEWLAVVKKVGAGEELTDDETVKLEEAKKAVADFLETCTKTQKTKFGGAAEDHAVLQSAVSSFKYKFSVKAFDIITHVVNLFVREIIVYANEECLATKLRVVNPTHIPWCKLQDKLFAGLYFNTPTVFAETRFAEEEEVVEEEVEDDVESVAAEEDEEKADEVKKQSAVKKIKLRQYIQTMFKSIRSSEERFNELKLSQKLIQILNDIVFEVLNRYANVLKTLLEVSSSKTVNDKFALYATKNILQDHVFATDEKTRVVFDIVNERLDRLEESKSVKGDDEEVEPEEEEVEVPIKKAAKKGKAKN